MSPASPVLVSLWSRLFRPEAWISRCGLSEVLLAKDQPQYNTLPALRSDQPTGRTTTRWKLTWRERLRLLVTGHLYIQVLTFQTPFQPIKPMVEEPSIEECR